MTDDVQTNNLTTAQGAEKIKSLLFPSEAPTVNQAEAEADPTQSPEIAADEQEVLQEVETETEQADDGNLYEVTIDGEKKAVTIDELIKGYQLEGHYTKKSQALAEERKAIETERVVLSAVNTKFEQLNDAVTYLQSVNDYIVSTIPPAPDQALLDSNPGEYIKRQQAHEMALRNLQGVQHGIADIKAKAKETVAELQRHGSVVISQKMPELQKPENIGRLYGYLKESYGYTPDQINLNVDPHLFIIAEKARRFDEMQNKAIDPKHVVQKAHKAKEKPRAYQNESINRQKAAQSEFQKNPNFRNAAELIKAKGLV